jgi:3'-phosphoadenosine 5'-phosphosulfate sulfotransferase (PAPS reductase)/FAD synthetase
MQGWSLEHKIQVTQTRIIEWYLQNDGKVFVSFSGGKDSTVLLDLARRVFLEIPAVFVDTGMEYPELREFVKTKENVECLNPKLPFFKIIEQYGYPVISKEVSNVIDGARKGQTSRVAKLNGEILDKDGKKSIYNCENYRYLLDAPFKISDRCCYHMKKAPIYKYERQTGRKAIIGTMACESRLRMQSWLKAGCNGFESARPISQPLAFWLEQDILRYLQVTGISYAPIYGDIIAHANKQNKDGSPILTTTGVSRSGCMFCLYGVHLESEPNRFQLMQKTHPKQYQYCIYSLGCGKVMDYIHVAYKNNLTGGLE